MNCVIYKRVWSPFIVMFESGIKRLYKHDISKMCLRSQLDISLLNVLLWNKSTYVNIEFIVGIILFLQ